MKKKRTNARPVEKWHVSEGADYDNDAFIISTEEIKRGIDHYGPSYVAHITIQGDEEMSYDDVKERARGRAALIAAAPDLLAAAVWALEMIGAGYVHPPLDKEPRARFRAGYKALCAAILKAERKA